MLALRILRNSNILADHEAALAAIQAKVGELADGEVFITSYSVTGGVASIVTIKRADGYTSFDVEGIGNDIDKKIKNAIAALDKKTESSDGTNVQVKVTQTDGKVTAVNIITDNTVNATDVSNAINAYDESIKPVAKSGSADDVATKNISASENNVAITGATVPAQIKDIATILKTMQDGVINYKVKQLTNAEIALLPDAVNVKEAYKVVSYAGEEMYVKVNPAEEIISPITATEYEALTTEQKGKYKLDDTQYTQVGDTIKIYKDSALDKFYLGHVNDFLTHADAQGESEDDEITYVTGSEALVYVQQLANGKYKLVAVDVESFLMEAEFKDGLNVSENHEVKVKIDSTSDTGLSVSPNGLKLTLPDNDPVSSDGTNVQVKVTQVDGKVTAVNITTDNTVNATDVSNAINALDATVRGNLNSSDNLESGKLVGVKVVEANGKLDSVTVVENTVWDCGEY